MNEKKLYRSRTDRKIAGVAGGLAEHLSIDTVIVRIIFVCLFFCAMGGGVLYLILWIVIPEKPWIFNDVQAEPEPNKSAEDTTSNNENFNTNTDNMETNNEQNNIFEKKKKSSNLTAGIILITLGVLFLCERFIPNVNFEDLWPILLIVVGITIIFRGNTFKNKKQF